MSMVAINLKDFEKAYVNVGFDAEILHMRPMSSNQSLTMAGSVRAYQNMVKNPQDEKEFENIDKVAEIVKELEGIFYSVFKPEDRKRAKELLKDLEIDQLFEIYNRVFEVKT